MTDEPEDNDEQPGDGDQPEAQSDEPSAADRAEEWTRDGDEDAARAALEEEFMAAGEDDEEVDPELMALAEERSRPSALRPILFIAVIALGIWIVGDFRTQIEYFFSSSDPVQLGEIAEMAKGPDEEPNWSETFSHNRYVELAGIPKRRSESRKYRYFKLVGAPVYVEQPLTEVGEAPEPKFRGPNRSGPEGRTYFEGKGRMIAFGKMPDKYAGVKHYYRKKYGTRFCENLSKKDKQRIRSEQRSTIIDNWRARYDNASKKERQKKGLTPEPSDEELQEILNANEICTEAFLVQATVSPRDHWMYVLTAALFGLFMLLNVYWLIRWFRDFFRSDVDVSAIDE